MDNNSNDKLIAQSALKKTLGPQPQLAKSPPAGEKSIMKKQGAEKALGKNKKRVKKRKSKLTKLNEAKGLKTKQKISSFKKAKGHKRKLDLKKKLSSANGLPGSQMKSNNILGKHGRTSKDVYNVPFQIGSETRMPGGLQLNELVNNRALSSLLQTHDSIFEKKSSPFASSQLGLLQRANQASLSYPNQQQQMIRSPSLFQKTDENYWIKRSDKFEREKQLLLILDDMLEQIKQFTLELKIVDFVKISENLSHYNLSPKICIRLWEALKKKLKDLYKRENEFQALCRNEVNVDFWTETIHMFKQRIQKYERTLRSSQEIDLLAPSGANKETPIFEFQKEEVRFNDMVESYFQLFEEPNKLVTVMQDLQQKLDDSKDSQLQVDKLQQQRKEEDIRNIDSLLNDLLSEIEILEDDREIEVLKRNYQNKFDDRKEGKAQHVLSVEQQPWSLSELSNLIRGVFRFGENEWNELLEDIEVNPARTPNQLAVKWRQIKQLMNSDIKRYNLKTGGAKIITKHEWMISALEVLEKDMPKSRDIETPKMLYEALFIDPSKLTPYQQSQLEYQRQQQQKMQDYQSGTKKQKLYKSNTLDMSQKLDQTTYQLTNPSIIASNEESKENDKKQGESGDQQIPKGLIDLKEYAPHILEQANIKINRSQSMGTSSLSNQNINQAGFSGANKDFEFCSQESLKLLSQTFNNPLGNNRLYSQFGFGNNSLIMQPPQNQIVPKDFPDQLGEKSKNYSQVINRRREQNSLGINQNLNLQFTQSQQNEFQKPIYNESLNLKKLLLQNNMQRQQQQLQQKPLIATPDISINNVNPEPSVIKPNTLKYIAPQCVQKDSNQNTPNSPKMERKGSFGSVSSVFSKPQISHQRQVQHNTIINNYYINSISNDYYLDRTNMKNNFQMPGVQLKTPDLFINNNIQVNSLPQNFFAPPQNIAGGQINPLNSMKSKQQQQTKDQQQADKQSK